MHIHHHLSSGTPRHTKVRHSNYGHRCITHHTRDTWDTAILRDSTDGIRHTSSLGRADCAGEQECPDRSILTSREFHLADTGRTVSDTEKSEPGAVYIESHTVALCWDKSVPKRPSRVGQTAGRRGQSQAGRTGRHRLELLGILDVSDHLGQYTMAQPETEPKTGRELDENRHQETLRKKTKE